MDCFGNWDPRTVIEMRTKINNLLWEASRLKDLPVLRCTHPHLKCGARNIAQTEVSAGAEERISVAVQNLRTLFHNRFPRRTFPTLMKRLLDNHFIVGHCCYALHSESGCFHLMNGLNWMHRSWKKYKRKSGVMLEEEHIEYNITPSMEKARSQLSTNKV